MKSIYVVVFVYILFSCRSYSHEDTYVQAPDIVPQESDAISPEQSTESLPEEDSTAASEDMAIVELGLIQKEIEQEVQEQNPITQVMRANHEALQEPNIRAIQNSLVVYNYYPNYMYRIYTSPQRVTVIRLDKGEEIVGNLVSGDTANWIIAVSKDKDRSIIYIKPIRDRINTNLVINTDQRSYYLVLKSLEETYMVSVEWRYPMQIMSEKDTRHYLHGFRGVAISHADNVRKRHKTEYT